MAEIGSSIQLTGVAADAAAALRASADALHNYSLTGGYGGFYTPDGKAYAGSLSQPLAADQIWIQPPGTTSVGDSFLRSYEVLNDPVVLGYAIQAGQALSSAQMSTGGWNYIGDGDAAPRTLTSPYTTLDDSVTQSALNFLMHLDRHVDATWLDQTIQATFTFLLTSQSAEGAWQQSYGTGFPAYRTLYTFNDRAISDTIDVLLRGYTQYGDSAYLNAALKGADFIIATQATGNQAGWAAQYDRNLQPAPARAYEPAALDSSVTADNVQTLLEVYLVTGDAKYLTPIVPALQWLEQVKLGPDLWARFYELGTNRPIYAKKDGTIVYSLAETDKTDYLWQDDFNVAEASRNHQLVTSMGRDAYLAEHPLFVNTTTVRPLYESEMAFDPLAELENGAARALSKLQSNHLWMEGTAVSTDEFVDRTADLQAYLDRLLDGATPPPRPNTAPVIGGTAADQPADDTITILPFGGVTISDPDGQTLTVTVSLDAAAKGVFTAASLASSGFAAAAAAGSYIFTGTAAAAQAALRQLAFDPADNRIAPGGTETTTFTISVSDGVASATSSATTVVATSINDAPTAGTVAATGTEDASPIAITLTGDDIDALDAVESFTLTTLPANGILYTDATLITQAATATAYLADAESLTFYFVPTATFSGDTTFTYTASDGDLSSAAATATLHVTALNDAPTASAVEATGTEDVGAIAITLNGDDIDPLDAIESFTLTTLPANGILYTDAGLTTRATTGTAYPAGAEVLTLYFVPAVNFSGDASFTYTASDGDVSSAAATATLQVTAVNDAPTAAADIYSAASGQALAVTADAGVLKNDGDVDPGTTLQALQVQGPANGSLVLNANGSFNYTPNAGFSGTDSFTYKVSDGALNSPVTTVTINVAMPAPPPDKQPINGTAAAETLVGTDGNDIVNALGGNDAIRALAGDDVIDGGSGSDRMEGGVGNDSYYVNVTTDNTVELPGQGVDTVISIVTLTLKANVENLTLAGTSGISGTGTADANVIVGNDGKNTLKGLAGDDLLRGGLGVDALDGGLGADLLEGGGGADKFVFRADIDVGGGDTGLGHDTVTDFATGDRLDFSPIDAKSATSGSNDAFSFIAAAAFGGSAGQLRYVVDAVNDRTYVEGDTDGDRTADFQLVLLGTHTLIKSDLVL